MKLLQFILLLSVFFLSLNLFSYQNTDAKYRLQTSHSIFVSPPIYRFSGHGLNAIIVGLTIDGEDGIKTKAEFEILKKCAKMLKETGVNVHEFYGKDVKYSIIKSKLDKVHFFIYSGNGVYDSIDKVGGLDFNDKILSNKDVEKDFHLVSGAVVLLNANFSSGSSATDQREILEKDAFKRVSMYSSPYLFKKVAAYYATSNSHGFLHYLANLFSGKSFGQSFKDHIFLKKVKQFSHSEFVSKEILIFQNDQKIYSNAFVGSSLRYLSFSHLNEASPSVSKGSSSSKAYEDNKIDEIADPTESMVPDQKIEKTLPKKKKTDTKSKSKKGKKKARSHSTRYIKKSIINGKKIVLKEPWNITG